MHVSRDLVPGWIYATTTPLDVDEVHQLLDGPHVHVEAAAGKWRNGTRVETGWTITVAAFIEVEGLQAIDEA
jgi:hypothetical protein